MRRVVWFFQFIIIALVTLPVAVIPHRPSLKIGGLLGRGLYHIWGSRRRIAIANLRDAISRGAVTIDSTPEEIIRQNFINLGKSIVEVLKIYYGFGGSILKNVEIRGVENFRRAQEKGKGTILITGHCGNWELNAVVLSKLVTKVDVVARPIDNPYLNRVVERTRKKYGNGVIYKKGALRKILASLKANGVVGILMDQSVVRSEGIIIDFLGKKAYAMKTTSILARKTGSPVVPLFIRRVNGGHVIEIGREIELDASEDAVTAVVNDTIRFSGPIEDYIKQNPAEWLWLHRRWKRIKEENQPASAPALDFKSPPSARTLGTDFKTI